MTYRRPNFFIIGAPKCGTTSLAQWLRTHPSVFFCPIKEPHYFATDLSQRVIRTKKAYRALFKRATSDHVGIGEASTWYLYSRCAIANIESYCPAAKLIVMTRDPVDMAISLHHHNLRVCHETEGDFEKAWLLQNARRLGRMIPRTCSEPAYLQYRDACSLGTLLERLLTQVSCDRILHISLEALQRDPGKEYRRCLTFLNISDDGRRDFPAANRSRTPRSRRLQLWFRYAARIRLALGFKRGLGLSRWNERPSEKAKLPDQFLATLDEEFRQEREKLDKMAILLQG